MTVKQQRILDTATKLFASEGVDAVSTARIAGEAEVSEGLIFRHFGSKRGLVEAVVNAGNDGEALERISKLADPGAQVAALIDRAFQSDGDINHRRKLRTQLSLLGRAPDAAEAFNETTLKLLNQAFTNLGYADPKNEAAYLYHALQGISSAVQRGELRGGKKLQKFVREMY